MHMTVTGLTIVWWDVALRRRCMPKEQPRPTADRTLPQPRNYQAPKLKQLGVWQAVTLQISVPISPGAYHWKPDQRQDA